MLKNLLRLFGPYLAIVVGGYAVLMLCLIGAHLLIFGPQSSENIHAKDCSQSDEICIGSR